MRLFLCWLNFKAKCIIHSEVIQDTFSRLDLFGQSQQTLQASLLKGERYLRQRVLWETLHHYSAINFTIPSSPPKRAVQIIKKEEERL